MKWETLFTPYNPGVGTVNRLGTFEARAFVPMPIILGIHVKYIAKTHTWRLNGRVSEGGRPVTIKLLRIYRGLSPSKLTARTTTKTKPDGLWNSAGHLQPRRTTYFQIGTAAVERDYTADGCAESGDSGIRTRRLCKRHAVTVDGEERHPEARPEEVIASGSGRALPCTA